MPLTFTNKDPLTVISHTVYSVDISLVMQRDTSKDSQIVEFLFQNVHKIFSEVGSFPRVYAEHRKALLEENDTVVAVL
jgi:hypothetical protein